MYQLDIHKKRCKIRIIIKDVKHAMISNVLVFAECTVIIFILIIVFQEEVVIMQSASQVREWWENKLKRHSSTCALTTFMYSVCVSVCLCVFVYTFGIVTFCTNI